MRAYVSSISGLVLSAGILVGCEGHLPSLNTAPQHAAPKAQDVVNHIACEIGVAMNYTDSTLTGVDASLTKRIAARVSGDPRIKGWLSELAQYHFVATAQISLEVTDTEGLTPSLQYLNNAATLTIGLGGQISGTQDRSLTLNYAIDLSELTVAKTKEYCASFEGAPPGAAGLGAVSYSGKAIAGDLGLADIIADGLMSLHATETSNVYGSSGPVPPVLPRPIWIDGEIGLPKLDLPNVSPQIHRPREPITIEFIEGTLQFAPQVPGSSTAGAVSLAGVASLKSVSGEESQYLVNWTGAILPQAGGSKDPVFFSLSGNLTPLPVPSDKPLATDTTADWGYSPNVTLTGSIDSEYKLSELHLAGTLTAAANSLYEKAQPITVQFNKPRPGGHFLAATTSTAVKGGAATAGAGGGTSFGSLVDFTLVYGLNGGPNWSFARFKGPAAGGSTPLVAATRTKIDSLAITFVATCQKVDSFSKLPLHIENYWQSIGPCNPDNSDAQQNGAAVGYQNNSLMILRNFLVK
jgi:hypothetical protein